MIAIVLEKMYFLKKISESSGIAQNALEDDLKSVEKELKYEKEEIKEVKEVLNYDETMFNLNNLKIR